MGGLAFGFLGAMVGSVGARKSKGICTNLIVRLLLNDFDNPEFRIHFISKKTRKTDKKYKLAMDNSLALTAMLKYVQSNGKPN